MISKRQSDGSKTERSKKEKKKTGKKADQPDNTIMIIVIKKTNWNVDMNFFFSFDAMKMAGVLFNPRGGKNAIDVLMTICDDSIVRIQHGIEK